MQAVVSDVPSHTPQRISVFALQTCVRKKALWGHTGPAPMPLSLGQPDLFRLPRARLQVPSALGEEDTRACKGGQGDHRARLLPLTHIYSAPASASPQASAAPSVSPNPSSSAPAPACAPARPLSRRLPRTVPSSPLPLRLPVPDASSQRAPGPQSLFLPLPALTPP